MLYTISLQTVSFNPRTNERCDSVYTAFSCTVTVSIRAPTRGAIKSQYSAAHIHAVSIRAPTRGAMATHSKIRLFRVPFHPHRSKNRRILGNPFPLTHHYASSLRKKTHRFYDHLRFALELSFGISHSFVSRLQNFGRPRPTTFFWSSSRRPTKRRVRPC